ncbi:hypothetical protein [Neisseria musculi]|uniref:Lipoprotein n=1 Tax=Neisseria musculi TaxID=1815583 RepID=A0A7H1MBR1_9NEIS|nr:hypothetical protein [Neisseria musculi]QNT59076.1 hypothetical protein H7A79_1146 [Neisseria musculi]
MIAYLKHMMAGMLTATVMLLAGVLLHSCTEEAWAETPDLQRAAEMAAQAEVMKVEAQYDSMSADSKMEGIVYE